ncbi:MAG: hypothetical protein IKO52_07155 [Clostridia bacterium]|nr:hypothetical protein [Clostridia bacterium]
MKRTWILILLVCMLALLPAAVLAESPESNESSERPETVGTKEIISSVTAEGLQFDIRFEYMPSIKPLQGTNLIILESKTDNTLAVFTTEGEEVIPYGLAAVNALTNGFLTVSKDKENVNGLAIYKTDGTKISDFVYGSVTVYDARWVAGIVLAEASGGEKDLTVNKVNYLIGRCDLYFVSDEGVSLVASLDRTQFKDAKQHGDYIYIQDRNDVVTAYDREFQPIDLELKDLKTIFYDVINYEIVSKLTNEVIATGYTGVAEADLPNRLLLLASTTAADGSKRQAILDTDGKALMPAEYTVVTMGDPYVVVANGDGLRGLYSLAEKRLVVPCEFTNIIASKTSIDQYVNMGYVAVEKDGMSGFVDVRTGSITCPPAYNSRIAKVYGCSLAFDGEKGFVLIAADGTRTELYEYQEIAASRGDGYLIVAKKNGFYGVIDWHGNELLPFTHKTAITLTDDSKAMIRTIMGMELDVITAR